MQYFSILILFLFISVDAKAADPTIIFFGGAQSNQSLSAIKRCYPNFRVIGMGSSNADVRPLASEINSSANLNKRYILAGHSSGAASSNRLANMAKNPSRIQVISLDGFAPRDVNKQVRRICWNAANKNHTSWSKNARYMTKGNGCQVVHTYTTKYVSTTWGLHFALVNANVGNLSRDNWVSNGYKECKPNLSWARWE